MEETIQFSTGSIKALPPKTNNSNIVVPDIDIKDDENGFVLTIPVAGLQREQLNVCIKDCVLYISARKNKKHIHCGNDLCEHDCMLWRSAFSLPSNADTLMTSASFNLGQLVIRIPKTHPASQDDITIYVY